MKSCFFIGHREASSEVLPALTEAVEQHIVDTVLPSLSLAITVALTTWLQKL